MKSEEKKAFDWPKLVSAWEKSGIPQKIYCEQHGLPYARFVYERSLHLSRQQKASGDGAFLSVKQSLERPALPPVTLSPPPSPSPGFVLRCPNGYQLTIPLQADSQTLSQLLSFIGRSGC